MKKQIELYLVQFYDENEYGNVVHNEIYTTLLTAERRFCSLEKNLNCYSWVYLSECTTYFGRVRGGKTIRECRSCNGEDDYYHGDNTDF